MKYNKIKIIKAVSSIFILLFVFNVAIAQQSENSTNSKFENGTIVSSENATVKAELRKANGSYDEYMVGVYYIDSKTSVNNSMVKTNPVSTTGITYVKYNSENGAIRKGDLITSSSESGVGMKATKSGMVLGVALEDASAATGLIKIRVTIQYVKQ